VTVENRSALLLEKVNVPSDLVGDARTVESGYAPSALPGVRLLPGFFRRVGTDLATYPSRWAFTDYLAVDAAGGHLALHTVNPAPAPLRPVELGFVVASEGQCSAGAFCATHGFRTWIRPRGRWTSPLVRLRVGETVEQTILAHRRDNGFDRYPSLSAKLGARLDGLARAPLVKLDPVAGRKPFAGWLADLRRLPAPSLLHPVAFQPGGHDRTFPDFLPPDPRWGTTAELRSVVTTARGLGHLVAPYLNLSWWDVTSPTARRLADPLAAAVRTEAARPLLETYVGRRGVVVSPHAPAVRTRLARLVQEWRTTVPADCLFFDQIGARPWLRDFHPRAPRPEAYYDGWLKLLAPYRSRCLMVEDGWDRLAASAVAFHGSLLQIQREVAYADEHWGAGNWVPYPLATWLLHDKVLLYQHDLYDGTFANDLGVLTWNAAFGLGASWEMWTRPRGDPWFELAAALQRTLGPRFAGRPLASFRQLGESVTESRFGDLAVVADWSGAGYRAGAYDVAPGGFLARSDDGAVLAGAFAGAFAGVTLSPGTHHLVVERTGAGVTVRQPIGADTPLAVAAPAPVVPYAADGTALGPPEGELRDGRLLFVYRGTVAGRTVAYYRSV
jgi:hypothetical protein